MSEKEPRAGNEILDQLRELGGNLETLIRKMWESDQGKEVREQFSSGLKELNEQVDRTVESIKANQDAQKLRVQAEEQWKAVGGSETAEGLRKGIRDALKALNERMNHLAETIPSDSSSKEQDKPQE